MVTTQLKLDAFTLAYIEAALWSTSDESNEQGGEPLDANYSIDDLADETLASMIADCQAFQRDNASLITDENCSSGRPAQHFAGHDFWLTRNGHGCGFWDGDWQEEAGDKLTEACKQYREVNLYVGDDGKIYS